MASKRFPWIFGIFHAYESEADMRGDYALIEYRLNLGILAGTTSNHRKDLTHQLGDRTSHKMEHFFALLFVSLIYSQVKLHILYCLCHSSTSIAVISYIILAQYSTRKVRYTNNGCLSGQLRDTPLLPTGQKGRVP